MEEIVVIVEETDNPVIKTDVAKYGYNEYATKKLLMTILVLTRCTQIRIQILKFLIILFFVIVLLLNETLFLSTSFSTKIVCKQI